MPAIKPGSVLAPTPKGREMANLSKTREPGWYWCKLRDKNPWAIFRWSGSNWWHGDETLLREPAVIDSECLYEPLPDDAPELEVAYGRAMSIMELSAQRDELVAALRETVTVLGQHHPGGESSTVVLRARAALAKAEAAN